MLQSVSFRIKSSANVSQASIRGSPICNITTMASLKVTIFCVLLGVASTYAKPPSAIVGGLIADDNEFPYQVSLRVYGQHVCGGSILDSTHIVTAAHCVADKEMTNAMSVVISTNHIVFGGITHSIKKITSHPSYSGSAIDSWRNDIAVITLEKPIELGSRAKPVTLPTENPAEGTIAVASGWGNHLIPGGPVPLRLRKLEMRVISKAECSARGLGTLYESHMCAFAKKGSGVCSGDSGGPLALNGKLFGIASFVIPCGQGFPDVFTNVFQFVPWIKEIMAEA